MTEICEGNVDYKYNEKTLKCVLSDTKMNQNVIITEDDTIKYKDDMYIWKDNIAHCNNYSEKWQDWFCIKYYYLNNNYEQGIKDPEVALSNTISECFKPCEDNYVAVNNSDKCESLTTFRNKKYDGFLAYDPFAIICIIASKIDSNSITNEGTFGNHSNVLAKIANATDSNRWDWLTNSDNLYVINSNITSNLTLNDNLSQISSNIYTKDIKQDVDNAYSGILKYINEIRSENEEDQEKIKNNIKADLYNFFVLFDKRDDFYIDYLKHIKIKTMSDYFSAIKTNLKDGKRGGTGGGGGMEYAYNLAKKYDITKIYTEDNIEEKDTKIGQLKKTLSNEDYVLYLFYHACDICFSETSIFRIRLKNFLGIENLADAESKKDLKFFDYENNIFKKGLKIDKEALNKPLIPIKIEKDNIKIFGEYTEVFNYYKNILNLFPIFLLIIIAITVIFVILKITDLLILPLTFINAILSGALLLLLFIMKLIVNSSTIGIISLVLIQPAIYIYESSLTILKFIAFLVIFLHIEPTQVAAPANNRGVDFRWAPFNMFTSILLALMNVIVMVIRELLKSNVLFSLTAFFIYTIYAIIIKGDDVLDIIINADTSFLNIIDLKYKIYKNEILLDLYNNYITSIERIK
jgi:hypothetical protein